MGARVSALVSASVGGCVGERFGGYILRLVVECVCLCVFVSRPIILKTYKTLFPKKSVKQSYKQSMQTSRAELKLWGKLPKFNAAFSALGNMRAERFELPTF